jgi:CRISPR-associated protein Cas2
MENDQYGSLPWLAGLAKIQSSFVGYGDPAQDSLRFYFLGTEWRRRVEHIGAKLSYDPEAPLIL